MSRVYWDSMLFIYLIEGNDKYAGRVKEIYAAMQHRGDTLHTSVLTMGEVLTGPRRLGADDVVAKIRSYFVESGSVDLLSIDARVADRYSSIRANAKVQPADAIHLACAAESQMDLFITHDQHLQKLKMPGMPFITGLDMRLM